MKYKGYEIYLDEDTGMFRLLVDGETHYENLSLVSIKNAVDSLIKKAFKGALSTESLFLSMQGPLKMHLLMIPKSDTSITYAT